MFVRLTTRRTVFSLMTIILFALRSWMMFYLMRLVGTGVYSLVSVSFMLCGITAILFFGKGALEGLIFSVVVCLQEVFSELSLSVLEIRSIMRSPESPAIVFVDWSSVILRSCSHSLL